MYDNELDDKQREKMDERELQLYTIRSLMRLEQGRDFMWRCLQECQTFVNIFDVDQVVHAHRSGQREVGLWLESELKEAAPDEYLRMLKEHIDE